MVNPPHRCPFRPWVTGVTNLRDDLTCVYSRPDRRKATLGWVICVFLAACLSALGLNVCLAGTPSSPNAQLIAAIQILADQTDLRDPGEVGRVLQSPLIPYKRRESHSPSCLGTETPLVAEVETITYSPLAGFWFRTKPEGQEVTVPHWLGGASTKTGEPRFNYNVSIERLCYPGWTKLSEESDASIFFDDVPRFACITQEQLKALLPQARRVLATDGAVPYSYQGKVGKDSGTFVQFLYAYGAKCLLSARINQGTRYSQEMSDALEKRKACQRQTRAAMPNGIADSCGGYWQYLRDDGRQ